MLESRLKWNQKYEKRLKHKELPVPNPRLQNLVPYLKGGSALDLACGLGANSLFLAQKNYQVEAMDISDIAIQYLKGQSQNTKLNIHPSNCDLTNLNFLNTEEYSYLFDLVVMTYYLDRAIFPILPTIIKEDGYFFMETFYHSPHKQQKIADQYKLRSGELLTIFSNWQVLFYEENEYEGRQTIFARKNVLSH